MAAISLKINILDKEYQVNCQPEEREALEYSAQLLNEKMEEIRQGSHIIGLERIAVMAALNLAHESISVITVAREKEYIWRSSRIWTFWSLTSLLSSK